jgi:hypothetical protein
LKTVANIKNYSCDQTGYITSKVLGGGKHQIEFAFGADVKYANNLAEDYSSYGQPDYVPRHNRSTVTNAS